MIDVMDIGIGNDRSQVRHRHRASSAVAAADALGGGRGRAGVMRIDSPMRIPRGTGPGIAARGSEEPPLARSAGWIGPSPFAGGDGTRGREGCGGGGVTSVSRFLLVDVGRRWDGRCVCCCRCTCI